MDGLWEKANQVSEVGYKIHSVASVAALLGESMSDDVNSGVAWALHEMLLRYSDDLDRLSVDLMELNRGDEPPKIKNAPTKGNFTKKQIKDAIAVAKGKKK